MKIFYPLLALLFFFPSIINAHPGIGIVMDSKGNVFYTDLVHVWKISAEGEVTIAVEQVHTHELYIDEQDNLYGEHEWYEGEATDKWGNYVWCLTKEGVLLKTIPDVEGFLDNNTLVRDPEGNTFWIDKSGNNGRLIKQTTAGINTMMSTHSFENVRWMHYSKSCNKLYIVDQLILKEVSLLGDVRVIASDLKEGRSLFGVADHHYVFGPWTDEKKNVYIAVYGAGKVKKISPAGKISTIHESGKFWSPCGGLTASDGTHWIMEFSRTNKTRIRRIGTDGAQTVFNGE
jgi:hypothetical protein